MELATSSAAERNKGPVLEVLRSVLPARGSVLEIASGTGQHVCHFAQALPGIRWQPTEPEDATRGAMAVRIARAGLTNVAEPVSLDVTVEPWPVDGAFDAILCINMVHISPWSATLSLMGGAARHLHAGGRLVLYGPYLEDGTAAPSNLEFDSSLKLRNPQWGLRDLEEVTRVAATHGLHREHLVRMPANNLTLVFARRG